jgi:hypothetical protein
MFITLLSARPNAMPNNYKRNGRGLLVSNTFGFGLMDAGRMVELAKGNLHHLNKP